MQDNIEQTANLFNKEMELAAIWMDKPTMIIRDGEQIKAIRLVVGDKVFVDKYNRLSSEGEIWDVIGLTGTILSNSMRFHLQNEKKETKTINA